MTRTEWEALQRRLPIEDRTSYEDYLASQGMIAPAPSRTAAAESGTIGAASIASQLSPEITQNIQSISTSGASVSTDNPPATGLKAGYEWYKFNLPGGGFEWRQKPTRETLLGAYTSIFTAPLMTGGSPAGGAAVGTGASANVAAQQAAQEAADAKRESRQSAYDFLFEQFSQYGLGSLVENIKDLITSNVPPSEFAIRLRETDAYKKRFAANAQRVAKGLRALNEGAYIALEDQYQEIMRNYGLPASYYARGEMGRQQGFEKFIAGDVSAPELEDRIQTAYNRVINAAPEISQSLREFYPDITNGDILAYVLDPDQGLQNIKRRVTSAEIGGAARMAGLGTGVSRAEELQRYGVTGAQAREGFGTIAGGLQRGTQLSQIYQQPEYTQTTAEQEIFGLTGAAGAEKQRKKIIGLERATFGGQTGATGGALARERAGGF